MYSFSKKSIIKIEKNSSFSHRSIQKSELVTTSYDPTANRTNNPYAQLLERFRKAEKIKLKNSDTKIDHKSFDSIVKLPNNFNQIPSKQLSFQIDTNIHIRIQKLLSFFHSLDDNTTDNIQNSNTFDENTLIALFSVDNHLLSSIYVPTNIQQLNMVPKSILYSLRNTPDDEQLLNKVNDYLIKSYVCPLTDSR